MNRRRSCPSAGDALLACRRSPRAARHAHRTRHGSPHSYQEQAVCVRQPGRTPRRPRARPRCPITATPARPCAAASASSALEGTGSVRVRLDAAHQHADAMPAAHAPLPQRADALAAWRATPRPPRTPGCRRATTTRRRPCPNGRQAGHGREPLLDVDGIAAARLQAPDHLPGARQRPAEHQPADRAPAAGHDGAARRVGGAHWPRPVEHQHGPLPRPRCPPGPRPRPRSTVRGPIAGMSTRSSWPGLGPLASTPPRRRQPSAAGQAGDPLQHRVGAFGAFDGQHLAVRHHHRLAGIERAQRRAYGKAQPGIGAVLLATAPRCRCAPAPASRSGATSCAPRTVRPLLSKKRTTRVSTESSPPASRPHDAAAGW